MKWLLCALFEGVHMLGMALVFGAAALLTRLSSPSLLPESLGISHEESARLFGDLVNLVGEPAQPVLIAALVGAVVAPYIRNDKGMALAWLRVLCVGGAIGIVALGWEDVESILNGSVEDHASAADAIAQRGDRMITPWNGLAFLTGLNLLLAALQMFSARSSKKD